MAGSEQPNSTRSKPAKDTGYTPGDDFASQWRNIFSYISGRMTSEGIEQFRVDRDVKNEAVDCGRCERQRDWLLQYSTVFRSLQLCPSLQSRITNPGLLRLLPIILGPAIRFLQNSIKQLGGDLGSHNIYCRRCTHRQAGGFDPDYGIQICANEMKDRGHLEDTMAHEMVHAYDHLRFKLDWTDNLRHAACTEVSDPHPFSSEASRQSGGSLTPRARIDSGELIERRMPVG
jgi:inner membrane protease ATP23